jgi:hypothetical protein
MSQPQQTEGFTENPEAGNPNSHRSQEETGTRDNKYSKNPKITSTEAVKETLESVKADMTTGLNNPLSSNMEIGVRTESIADQEGTHRRPDQGFQVVQLHEDEEDEATSKDNAYAETLHRENITNISQEGRIAESMQIANPSMKTLTENRMGDTESTNKAGANVGDQQRPSQMVRVDAMEETVHFNKAIANVGVTANPEQLHKTDVGDHLGIVEKHQQEENDQPEEADTQVELDERLDSHACTETSTRVTKNPNRQDSCVNQSEPTPDYLENLTKAIEPRHGIGSVGQTEEGQINRDNQQSVLLRESEERLLSLTRAKQTASESIERAVDEITRRLAKSARDVRTEYDLRKQLLRQNIEDGLRILGYENVAHASTTSSSPTELRAGSKRTHGQRDMIQTPESNTPTENEIQPEQEQDRTTDETDSSRETEIWDPDADFIGGSYSKWPQVVYKQPQVPPLIEPSTNSIQEDVNESQDPELNIDNDEENTIHVINYFGEDMTRKYTGYESNVYSRFDNLEPRTTAMAEGDHLHYLKRQLDDIKQLIRMHSLGKGAIETQYPNLRIEEYPEQAQRMYNEHELSIEQLQRHFTRHNQAIANTKATQKKFRTQMEVPEDVAMDTIINMRELKYAVPECNGDNFKQFFKKLTIYGQIQGYSHKNYKQCLLLLLTGPIYDTYTSLEHLELQYIINELTDMYVKADTITDFNRQLENFTRKPNEGLRMAIARFSRLLAETEFLYSPDQRKTRNTLRKEQCLKSICSKSALIKINEKKMEGQRCGQIIPFNILLDLAENAEETYKDIPKTEATTKVSINTLIHQAPADATAVIAQTIPNTQDLEDMDVTEQQQPQEANVKKDIAVGNPTRKILVAKRKLDPAKRARVTFKVATPEEPDRTEMEYDQRRKRPTRRPDRMLYKHPNRRTPERTRQIKRTTNPDKYRKSEFDTERLYWKNRGYRDTHWRSENRVNRYRDHPQRDWHGTWRNPSANSYDNRRRTIRQTYHPDYTRQYTGNWSHGDYDRNRSRHNPMYYTRGFQTRNRGLNRYPRDRDAIYHRGQGKNPSSWNTSYRRSNRSRNLLRIEATSRYHLN